MTNTTAATVLPAHTRVTFTYAVRGYKAQETQGIVLEGSTDKLAKVEVLGLAQRKTIGLPWSAVTKVEYRCFTVSEDATTATITEVEPKNTHPMNWTGLRETTREGAWKWAGARGKRVVFVSRDGEVTELGEHFSPRDFERAAYQGATGYEYSMTDYSYRPEKFETWVKRFRQFPEQMLMSRNDAEEAVKAALPKYLEALKGLAARQG